MMGLGTDILEIDRMRAAMQRPRFVCRVFTPAEQAWLDGCGENRAQSAAGLFCAKEAIAKALGTGFQNGLRFLDIEIGHTALGAPVVLRPHTPFLLSISHCQSYATATAIALNQSEEISHA